MKVDIEYLGRGDGVTTVDTHNLVAKEAALVESLVMTGRMDDDGWVEGEMSGLKFRVRDAMDPSDRGRGRNVW